MKKRGVPDFLLLFLTVLLIGFGITMVLSASSIFALANFTANGCEICKGDGLYFVKKQLTWLGVGAVGMIVAMNLPYTFYKRMFVPIAFFCLLLLVAVLFVGVNVNNSTSWIRIGSFGFQPSELAKLGLILYLAAILAKKADHIHDFRKGLFPPLFVSGLFFLLIVIQRDFGSAAILLGTAIVMILCAGASFWRMTIYTAVPAISVLGGYLYLNRHAQERLTSFLDPWSDSLGNGFHVVQSYFAMARGGVTGTGYGKSIQKYLYLPEAHTDFIFSVIAEELGWIGTCLFLLVYLAFIVRGLIISLRTNDAFAMLAGTGIVSMIGLQALINMGGVTGTIPLTGVPLPFISYGGSSLLVCMISAGILLSISRESNRQNQVTA